MENKMKYITHGSENSLDHDIYVIVDSPLSPKESKSLCYEFNPKNANLIQIDEGKVVWSYKGTIDECNNSILHTFKLHKQTIECPIKEKVQRLYGLKMLRTVRGLLSYCSRTDYRNIVKSALKNKNIFEKFNTLKEIDISTIKDYKKSSIIETYKFFAFQLGQTIALLEDNKELFTKNAVAEYYPELAPALMRQNSDVTVLVSYWERFISVSESHIKEIEKQPDLFRVDFFGKKEIYNTKEECLLPPVVVFDLDGTLYNEEHRSHLRDKDSKHYDLEAYFSACDKDTPIQSIVDILLDYKLKGYEIWLASGRCHELCYDKTLKTLKRDRIPYDGIKLRGKNVYIPDYVLKPAWMAKYIGLDRIEAVYDDKLEVIEGFRKKGLNVIDVTKL